MNPPLQIDFGVTVKRITNEKLSNYGNINNYLFTQSETLQGQGLRSFHKDGAIEGNNLIILWLFDCFSTSVNGPLQEKSLLELANHESARYIGYKQKPCDKESYLWTANRQF